MSEEITLANAVPIAKKWLGPMVLRHPMEWRYLITALVARVEELERGRPRKSSDGGKTWQPQTDAEIEENGRFIARLEWKQQRDAAVAVLRSSENQPSEFRIALLTNAEAHAIAAVFRGCISDALAALGVEETT
jgi:hypothetical protein